MQSRATLKPAVLKDLLSRNGVNSVCIQDAEGGFSIRIGFGGEDKLLGLVKEDRARVFKTLKGAKAHLVKLGIEASRIDAPLAPPAKTPQRTVRPPRKMSEAALMAELEEALAQIDDGTAELIDCGPDIFSQIGAEIRARHAIEGPPITRTTVEPDLLDVLMTCGGIDSAYIQPADGGFRILIGHNEKEEWVGYANKDRVRIFKTLKSAQAHLKKFGIEDYSVDEACVSQRPEKPEKRFSLH